MIAIRTIIGYGSPNKQGSSSAHGSPLGDDEVALAKQNLGWSANARFHVPGDALEHFRGAIDAGAAAESEWEGRFAAWRAAYPTLAEEWDRAMAGEFAPGWRDALPSFGPANPSHAQRRWRGVECPRPVCANHDRRRCRLGRQHKDPDQRR